MSKLQNFLKGLIKENPVLVLVLGMNLIAIIIRQRMQRKR